MITLRIIGISLIAGVLTAAASDYPPDPMAMSKAMHELSIIIFRTVSRETSAEQEVEVSRAANEAFWREVLYARESGYGLP